MYENNTSSKHTLFLQAALRENAEKFADVRICCSDGCVKQNRVFLGIVESYLQNMPEFCSPDVDTLVMLPDVSLQEYFSILNEKLFNEDVSEDYDDNFLKVLTKGVFYAGNYEELPKMDFPENIENIEIIMHDVFADSDDIVSKTQESFPDIYNVPTVNPSVLSQQTNDLKKFSCPHCDRKFVREKAFLAHKSNYHNESVKVEAGKKPLLSCKLCGLKFEAPVQMEKHMLSHTKAKPFQCLVCNKGFVSKSNLSAHQRLHEGTALRYKCTLCDKKFSHRSEVKQHMVVHTGNIKGYYYYKNWVTYSLDADIRHV